MEYDPARDLLYSWFGAPGEKAARTEIVVPGVYADFSRDGKSIEIEVVDASEMFGDQVQFEVVLATPSVEATTEPS